MKNITGRTAITIADAFGVPLYKHADPTEEARSYLPRAEALSICAQDPRLVYVDSGEVAAAVPTSDLAALRLDAIEHDDIAQRIICDMALDGEDSQYDEDCLDDEGRPDYSGGGHSRDELGDIQRALRMTRGEARVECARVIAAARAQS